MSTASRGLGMVVRGSVAGLAGLLLVAGLFGAAAEDQAAEERLKKDIEFLASADCEGRGVTTQGINKAADYIADSFKAAGLKPADKAAGWFQPFTMGGVAKLGNPNSLVLKGPLGQQIELAGNKGFQPMGLSASGKLSAPIVFAGYGAVSKEDNYDDYAGLDVANKVVLLIRRAPRYDNANANFGGAQKNQIASFITKFTTAEANKAAAVLMVNDRGSAQQGDNFVNFAELSRGGSPVSIPVIQIRRQDADAMLQASLGQSLKQIEEDIDRDLKPRSAPLGGWSADLQASVSRPRIDVKNVIGVLEGAGPLANETVVIGAHYDHLGFGGAGSLAKDKEAKAIHHGADDNASGTSVLMEVARHFGQQKDRQGRRLVFIAFSAEESGLLGSEHYCKNPLYPLDNTVAMVNFDMVGRMKKDAKSNKDKLIVYGTGTAKTFDKQIDALNQKYEFQLSKKPEGIGPSDHSSFYQRKVPVYHFFTDVHPDYHRPSDTAEKINVPGMRRIADLSEELVTDLSTAKERPEYLKVAGSASSGTFSGPRIGIRPAYDNDKDGVLISGVTEKMPAEKAGLKAEDRIIEVNGVPVKTLEVYMTQMARFKKGDKIPLTILRDTKKLTIVVVPE